ncbi:MAG: AAA family ATPase [Deltaproteobacteria bacterium]|nr:AAA family ATPase [Deltaproteobacteria bacterium]
MSNVSDCRIISKIYESNTSTVYRAVRGAEELPVILKMLKQDYPTPEHIVKYKQEYRITRALEKLSNVIQVYGIEKNHNGLVITLEDFGAESLNLLMNSQKFSLEESLLIAIQICVSLGEIHAANVIHKDINPSNIVVNTATHQLKIIDFGIATDLAQENAMLVNPSILEGTLAYMSPEQTGRMNRPIDYRSDYYSLGATVYELFTGRLPFETTDPLELVHCHIARKPTPPHEINHEIHEGISDIILKLMAKNAEDRYQSAFGVKADLELCLSQVRSNKTAKAFQLARSDIPEKFVITPHLYGRDDEKQGLIAAFDRVAAGNKEIAVVSGQGGIGKTSLVRQLYKPITKQRGYFLTGKFDQLHGNVLHGAVVAPFRELVNQILSESENNLIAWKSKLLDALGSNCKVIMDLIPEIELILGPQPSVPELEPLEAQNRFHLVFQSFIRVFCRPEQPLVVFLDDVQWADSSSLKLLELMMTDPETKYLLVIVSYRDEEVDASHPLMMTLEALRKENIRINILHLGPLQLEHVVELISDTIHRDKLKVIQLAELVHQKTAGNPFFLKEFLKSLHDEGLLEFDSAFGGWLWAMEQIQRREITDNVVDLMANKIQRLPAITRDLLKDAACIGNQFGVNTLAWSFSDSPRNVVVALNVAVSEGLIFPVGAGYKWIELEVLDTANTKKIDYKFAHDRIQNAAYSLIPENERSGIHRRLGQIILDNTPADHLDDEIFEIVNQLNLAPGLISNDKERVELAEMNLRAGKKAKASAAYESAFTHFKTGLNLLGEDSWQDHYELTLTLFLEAVESAYLTTKFDEMERFASVVIEQATRLLDKVKVYEMKIQACIALNNRVEAVRTALPILALLGEKFPEDPGKLKVFADFMKTKLALANRGLETLVNLPEMADAKKFAAMRIMASVLSATYTVVPNLFPMIVFKMVRLSIKYGIARQSALAFSAYGMILCAIIGDVDSGCKLGNLALESVKRVNLKEDQVRINFVVNSFIRIWREPLRVGLAPLRDGYQIGLQVGDLEYAALSGAFYCTQGYAAGKELHGLEKELALYTSAIGKLKQETTKCLAQIYHQGVLNLMGHCENNCLLIGKAYNERDMLPPMFELNERAIILATFVHKLILCYLFHNYSEAVENSSVVENYLDGAQGTVLVPLAAFYGSLARLGLFSDSDAKLQNSILKKVTENQKILEKWSRAAPMNYLHKFHLVEAERERVLRRYHEAADHYDMAIKLARENEYLNEEALALEKAAIFYTSTDKTISARAYMQEARYCYLMWGALAKVRHLDEVYPHLLVKKSSSQESRSQISAVYPESPTSAPEGILDVAAVLKASQALSGEIVLNDLLKKLMSLLIETAGAENGVLILTKNNDLFVEARTSIVMGEEFELGSVRVEDSQELSLAVVNYVARTKEPVILDDAGRGNAFVNDDYMVRKRPRSVFCLPIMRSGQLSGILYMENNQTTGAFTPERVEVMGVLSAQAAISIENALLYKNLEESAIKYRSLFENAQETIFIVQDGSIKFSNPRTSELTGYSSEELSSLPFTHFIHPDDQDLVFEQNMKGLTEESAPKVYPFRIVRKDGATLWVQINSVLVNWERCPATLNFLTDITELKRAADLNIRSERLKAIGELASGVAHNFNNVLQVIMAGVEMALMDLESGNTSRIKNYLEQVRDSSRFGSETVKRLQSFAKIRAEGAFSDSKQFDLSQLITQVSEISRPWWKTNLERDGIRIDMKLDLRDGCFVLGKESELFEVLVNLIKNAAEAMPSGGDLRIRTSIIGDDVVLEIQDTGVGIASENMKRLFEPFWSTKGVSGTGLGLAVSHGILSSHGGTISVMSTVGEGTTFTIKLPLDQACTEGPSSCPSTILDLNLKILVIDDTAPLVTLLHDLLTGHNQTVLTAESGKQALDLFRENEVDLVICDLGMPEMSGWEVGRMVKTICQEKQISKTPFLLLTGWGGQSLGDDNIAESGVDGILEKPVDVPKLFEMIRKVVSCRFA